MAVAAIAAVVAAGLVAASLLSARDKTPRPTAIYGDDTAAMLAGIPQSGTALGRPDAPVTLVEFADLQCPYCRTYTTEALPTLVDQYVRTGKAKFVFSGMHFIGPDSEKALRAVYAAGLQSRLWQYLHLLYGRQGAENAGWVTDDLLRSTGASIPGFDTEKMLADMNSPAVTNALAAVDQQAQNASVNQTPMFFAGKMGATLQYVNVTALTPDGFRPTLDALTS